MYYYSYFYKNIGSEFSCYKIINNSIILSVNKKKIITQYYSSCRNAIKIFILI